MGRKFREFIAHDYPPGPELSTILFEPDNPSNHIPLPAHVARKVDAHLSEYLDSGVIFLFTKKGLMPISAEHAHRKPEEFNFFKELKP